MRRIPDDQLPKFNCEHCGNIVPRKRMIKRGRSNGVNRRIRFCSGVCRNLARNINPPKGHIDRNGYRVLPKGSGKSQVFEHRSVMEKMVGRKLRSEETENLELWVSRHGKGQRVSDLHQMSASGFAAGAMSLGG